MSELKRVFEGWWGTSRRSSRSRVRAPLFTLLGVLGGTGCGHYGVDLDGAADPSADASPNATGHTADGEPTWPDKPGPKPGKTSADPSSVATATSETSADSKPHETDSHGASSRDAGGETSTPVDTRSDEGATDVDVPSGDAGLPRDASVDGSVSDDAGADADVETSDHGTGREDHTSSAPTGEPLDAATSTCGLSCSFG